MRRIIALGWFTPLALAFATWGVHAEEKGPEGKASEPSASKSKDRQNREPEAEKKFRDFSEVTKGSEKIDGLFTLHRKDEHLYAEIKHHQFGEPFLAPINIARGMALAGEPLNFGDQWVLVFKRVGDKVHLLRRNVHYKAPAGSAVERAVKQNYIDSVLLSLPIVSLNNSSQSVLIDLADIFLTDFAQLRFFGSLDRSRTTWHKIKAYPNNLEIEVEATYSGNDDSYYFFNDGAADERGKTLIIHYSLVKAPDSNYHPRFADDRVGHFLDASKDFGTADADTYFVRQINRWRLEKADRRAKLSPPKKQIIWYIEETVPEKYRPAVEEGILEWNKAFEKIGFRNAIAVRWQTDGRDDFDPEDINYCTFRWGTADGAGAYSGLRSNPLTGEMIDGDVVFDDGLVRFWKQEYAFLTGNVPNGAGDRMPMPLAMGEIISPIMAAKKGFGLPVPPARFQAAAGESGGATKAIPAGSATALLRMRRTMLSGQFAGCQVTAGLRHELGMAAIALAAANPSETGEQLSEEALSQLIKYVVMHEVGHSLGLRHNFHASTMLTAEQINDPAITRVKGQSGSVMDYNPLNIAPHGQKQGDYTTTTIGPYDYWAIEYAYKPIDGDEKATLKKIAARSPDADLIYATDEDMYLDNDPLVNAFDLGSDPVRYARDRITLATSLMKGLDEKVVSAGEPWSRTRNAFSILLSQWGNAAYLASSYVGGQLVSRDHRAEDPKAARAKEEKEKKDKADDKDDDDDDDEKDADQKKAADKDKNDKAQAAKDEVADAPVKPSHDPITPIAGAKQREALALLTDQVLSDKAFRFSPTLLRRLAGERWYHWGNESLFYFGGEIDFPIYQRILGIQKIVLGQCLSPDALARLQNQELQAEPGSQPLTMAEVFRSLTDGIWTECKASDEKNRTVACSTIRRNLQREHLKKLSGLVLGHKRSPYEDMYDYIFFYGVPEPPADAKSLARLHLEEIQDRISKILSQDGAKIDETTRAHLKESRTRIAKVLAASLDQNEP